MKHDKFIFHRRVFRLVPEKYKAEKLESCQCGHYTARFCTVAFRFVCALA